VLRDVALVLTLVCLSTRLAHAQQAEPAPAAASPATAPAAPAAAPAIDAAAFATFIADVRQEALKRGISQATLDSALGDVQAEPTALERDRQQAEFALDLQAYLRRRLTKDTLKQARRVWHENHALATRVGKAYGVEPRMLVSVWGLESNFGRFSGVRPSVPTLATLAFDGRRANLFRGELMNALMILDQGDITLDRMKGSWAGALGQAQFLPSSYLAFAVDFDHDGKRDIWSSLPDVLASIGNYLKGHGWTAGMPWGYPVTVPRSATDALQSLGLRAEGCRAARELTPPQPMKQWRLIGLTTADGRPLPKSPFDASLLKIGDRAWLVTTNYEALLAYNCAHTYALSVATLASKIAR
jgi:membrane-bound lytic murein transglycosylase B